MISCCHQRVRPIERVLPDHAGLEARIERDLRADAPDTGARADFEALPRLLESPEHPKDRADRGGDPAVPALPEEVARVEILCKRRIEEVADQREPAIARFA